MSERNLALAASPETQKQIASLGGAVPNLTTAANAAVQEHLKSVMDAAKADAVNILQGYTAHAGSLVTEANRLARDVSANTAKQAEAKRAYDYFQATGNIFPLRKAIGLPTSKSTLAEFPAIDEIPKDWTAPAAAPASAS
jgi:hypothetical protein